MCPLQTAGCLHYSTIVFLCVNIPSMKILFHEQNELWIGKKQGKCVLIIFRNDLRSRVSKYKLTITQICIFLLYLFLYLNILHFWIFTHE